MNPYMSGNQPEPIDPVFGIPVSKVKDLYAAGKTGVGNIPQNQKKRGIVKPTGLSSDGLLDRALKDAQYNRDNKYKINGINMSNRMGDTIGAIADRLLR